MINRRTLLTGLALSFGARSRATASLLQKSFFGRGINIHHMLNWPALDPTNPQAFEWPPFRNAQYKMSDSEIIELAEMGFDFVRVTVSPAIFMQSNEERLVELKGFLTTSVSRFLLAGLRVIVDLHPIDQLPAYSRKALVADIDGQLFNRYTEIVRFITGALSQFPKNTVALELMNEPALLYDAIRWPPMLQKLYAAARQVSADLLLVLGGAQFDGSPLGGLMTLDPSSFKDPNIIYTFHYYEPISFTHQDGGVGKRWNQCLVELPWPVSTGSLNRSLTESIECVSGDQSMSILDKNLRKIQVSHRVTDYFTNNFGPDQVDDTFDQAATWADMHDIPRDRILLGEFGVTRSYGGFLGANGIDRERWITAVRRAAERKRFPWALWAYKGPSSMTLIGSYSLSDLDHTAIRALGLKVPAHFQSQNGG